MVTQTVYFKFQNEISLSLVSFRYPFEQIVNALAHAPNLQTIIIPGRLVLSAYLNVETLAKNQSLKKIWLTLSEGEYTSFEMVTRLESICARANFRGLATLMPPPPFVICWLYDPVSHRTCSSELKSNLIIYFLPAHSTFPWKMSRRISPI